ncbi:MAG: hypothetical protein RR525_09345 [Cellulosilyticaceae bacterium]
MYTNKYLTRTVNYFLPKSAEILLVGEDYKIPAVIEADIDKDEENEIITLYRRDQNNYILILKLFSKKWHVIWNNRTHYSEINRFEIAKLRPEYRQIALGGKTKEEDGYKLSLLDWQGESLQEMLSEPIPFDKLYIEDIDGEDGLDEIAIWKHKDLEAYDIELYRYKEGKLIIDESLEKTYFKIVVHYYEYLTQLDTEDTIYKKYLEEAKRKCEMEYKTEEVEETEEGDRKSQDILAARTAYLRDEQVEEDVYLWGERQEGFVTQLRLAVTKEEQTGYEIICVAKGKVYDYQMFVGDFTGNKLDNIWVGIKENKDSDAIHVCIYALGEGGFQVILDSNDLEKEIIEMYPVDKRLREVYEICYQAANKKTTWLRWENDVFVPYEQYQIEN